MLGISAERILKAVSFINDLLSFQGGVSNGAGVVFGMDQIC